MARKNHRNGWKWMEMGENRDKNGDFNFFYFWENDPMNGGLSSKPRMMKLEGNSLDLINKMGM